MEVRKCSVSRNTDYYFTKSFQREEKEYLRRWGQIKGLILFCYVEEEIMYAWQDKENSNEENLEDSREDIQKRLN